jgi:hypothetical protein
MKTLTARLFVAWTLACGCTLAVAQGTVYESNDKAGPVFSDQPSFTDQATKAKPIVVPPANVYQVLPSTPQTAPAPAAAVSPYTSFAISDPADSGTVHTNTGDFDVRMNPYPALRARDGDRIKVKFDGVLLPRAYQSGRIHITAADWHGAPSDSGAHTLQAAIVDKTGAVMIQSAPVSFFVHGAAVGGKGR